MTRDGSLGRTPAFEVLYALFSCKRCTTSTFFCAPWFYPHETLAGCGACDAATRSPRLVRRQRAVELRQLERHLRAASRESRGKRKCRRESTSNAPPRPRSVQMY